MSEIKNFLGQKKRLYLTFHSNKGLKSSQTCNSTVHTDSWVYTSSKPNIFSPPPLFIVPFPKKSFAEFSCVNQKLKINSFFFQLFLFFLHYSPFPLEGKTVIFFPKQGSAVVCVSQNQEIKNKFPIFTFFFTFSLSPTTFSLLPSIFPFPFFLLVFFYYTLQPLKKLLSTPGGSGGKMKICSPRKQCLGSI